MRIRLTGLWRHRDFMTLWAGQTISEFGSQITNLALPLTAVVILKANAGQMGLLSALSQAPFLLIGLLAGAWVDRLPRRPILMWSDVGRTLLLAAIPAAALVGGLRMGLLYAVGLLTGVLTVFFDVAYQAFLPSLVSRDQLIEGNSKLQVTASAAQVAGPGLAGWLVQVLTAPVAIFFDALSFLVSAVSLAFVRAPEPVQPKASERPGFWAEVGEGLKVVFGNPLLRSIAGCTATSNLFTSAAGAVYILFASDELKLSAGAIGVIFAIGNLGFLLGALVAGRMAKAIGLGRTIVLSVLVSQLAPLAIPFAPPRPVQAMGILIAAQIILSFGIPVYNINQVSLRQSITPHRLQGRMNATMRFLVWGTMPLGSLLGGALGTLFGLRVAMFVGFAGAALAFLWVRFSPVWHLATMPEPVDEPA